MLLKDYIKEMAKGDYEVGHCMDEDDMNEFIHILKDDGYVIQDKKEQEKAFRYYFECVDEVRGEDYGNY